MKESVFILKHKAIWTEFESFLNKSKHLSPDELAHNYIRISDDLAYARTFYPNSDLVSYLNNLTIKAHQLIYKNKKEEAGRFRKFWMYEVPKTFAESHKEMTIALIIFLVSITIGVVSSMQDANYPELILGHSYINMTKENIANGDPLGVYGNMEMASMFFGIASNNIYVSFLAYVLGIFGSVITGLLLLYNGVMVGAFLYFFQLEGMFPLAFTTIMLHGTLELTAIVIAASAGLIIGNALLFPGTYSRTDALRIHGKRSVKVIIGLVPIFIIAAIIESFVTRYYLEIGMVGRIVIILLSLIFVIWYFIIYPLKISKNERIQLTT